MGPAGIEPATNQVEWITSTFPITPLRTVHAPFSAHGSPGMRFTFPGLPYHPAQSRYSLSAFPCIPSPCIGHYPDHLSTMDTPSPCISRRLGDPQVPLHTTSVRRFPVRPTCFYQASLWRRSLANLITPFANSTLRGLGFKQFSLNHIQRSCLTTGQTF